MIDTLINEVRELIDRLYHLVIGLIEFLMRDAMTMAFVLLVPFIAVVVILTILDEI